MSEESLLDPERLLLKLNSGKQLSSEETAGVLASLEAGRMLGSNEPISQDDIYSLIKVLGKTGLSEHSYILARYLDSVDPLLVSLVLETLCLDWKQTGAFLERVISFALGVPWDDEHDVEHTALRILGEFLYDQQTSGAKKKAANSGFDPKLLHVIELLLSIFDDEEVEQWTRQAAYAALCRAYGKDWSEVPSDFIALDLSAGSTDTDHEMMTYFRELAAHSDEESLPSSSPSRFGKGTSPSGSSSGPGTR